MTKKDFLEKALDLLDKNKDIYFISVYKLAETIVDNLYNRIVPLNSININNFDNEGEENEFTIIFTNYKTKETECWISCPLSLSPVSDDIKKKLQEDGKILIDKFEIRTL